MKAAVRAGRRPQVTFVIPVRNDSRRLRLCLDSIARNGYPATLVEIIVVDNGSTDDSALVASNAGATVISEPNGRVAALRNRGATAARGELLAFVDADHEIGNDWIRAAVTAFAVSPDIAIVGALCHPPGNATWVQRSYDRLRARPIGRHATSWLGSGNLAIRRDVFEALGGFDTALESCEDVDLCNRVSQAGYRILSDSALRNVHFGDPSTLRALFWGELWRGRDNLVVTLRGPRTLRHLRSLLVPVADLVALIVGVVALPFLPAAALLPLIIVMGLALVRAAVMTRREEHLTAGVLLVAARCFAVALVYDCARALALVTRTGHYARRTGGSSSHVTANSHS